MMFVPIDLVGRRFLPMQPKLKNGPAGQRKIIHGVSRGGISMGNTYRLPFFLFAECFTMTSIGFYERVSSQLTHLVSMSSLSRVLVVNAITERSKYHHWLGLKLPRHVDQAVLKTRKTSNRPRPLASFCVSLFKPHISKGATSGSNTSLIYLIISEFAHACLTFKVTVCRQMFYEMQLRLAFISSV